MIGNKLTPFKFWCQKILPTVYDDSMSYYEYLCKLNEYLNEVIEQINTLTQAEEDFQADLSQQWEDYKSGLNDEWLEYKTGLTEEWNTYQRELTEAWLETKGYIDHYFDNLDVQTEINNKLDSMVTDGTMGNLIEAVISDDIPTSVTAWLTAHVDPVGSAVVVDNTLSITGAAADAKVTGDKIKDTNLDLLQGVNSVLTMVELNGLYDFVPIHGSLYSTTDGEITANVDYKRTPLIPVRGFKTIKLAKGVINESNIWFDINGNFISKFTNTSSSTGVAVTVPSTAYFFGSSTLETDAYFGVNNGGITSINVLNENLLNIYNLMNERKINLDFVNGEYVNASTGAFTPTSNTWSRTGLTPCAGYRKLYFVCSRANNYNAFYTKDGEFISNFNISTASTAPGFGVDVPSNAYYFALSNLNDDLYATEVRGVTVPIDNIRYNILSLMNILNENKYFLKLVKGEYVNSSNGSYVASPTWSRTEKTPCAGFDKIYFICSRPNPYNAWYDKDGAFISNFNIPSAGTVPGASVNVPSNACYFALSNVTEDMEATEARVFPTPINNIKENLNLLHESIPGVGTQLQYLTNNFDTPIKTVLSKQNKNSISMVFITDSHHMQVDNQIDAVSSIEYILERVGINAVVIGGDNYNDPAVESLRENSIPKWAMDYMNEAFRLRSDILPLVGNHDDLVWRISNYDGTWTGEPWDDLRPWYFSPTQLYNMGERRSMSYIHRDADNPDGGYYYYDIAGSDIRVLCLNTSDIPTNLTITKTLNDQSTVVYKYNSNCVIGTKQINFVKNMLENYSGKLIVCSHSNLNNLSEYGCPVPINGEAITGMLYAWKNGSTYSGTGTNEDIPYSINVTFANAHELIGCFNGHTHYDKITVVDGITYVAILNSECDAYRDSPSRTDGTYSKIAYDVITVDPDNKKVYLTRIGAGSNREFTYT